MLKAKIIHVILNSSSGLDGKEDTPALLNRVFLECGFETKIHAVEKGTDLRELTKRLVRDGAEVVVAGGGDGTLNAVASALAGSDVPMGILPAGTLNHFARDLNIPFDKEAAARVIAAGKMTRVDLGEVNGRHFINNAIIGLYPAYRFQRDAREGRGYQKAFAIASALFSVIRRNPALAIRIGADGESMVRRTPFLMVSNNKHEMEGYRLGNRDSLSEGQLWLYVMHRMSRLGLIGLAASIILGQFSKWKDFDLLSAKEMVVESKRKSIGISLDGEVMRMKPPLHYRSLPDTLCVIVPSVEVANS